MTFETIKQEIKSFGKRKYQLMKDYIVLNEELKNKLNQGLVGTKTAKDQLDKAYKDAKDESRKTAASLVAKVENIYEKELEKLKTNLQSVTADDVAELTLLASIKEVTKEELEMYFVKYANKPLALKKLREIANEKLDAALIDFDIFDVKQVLYNLSQRFKQEINFIDGNYLVNGDKISLAMADMTINGTMEHLDQLVDEYLNGKNLSKVVK